MPKHAYRRREKKIPWYMEKDFVLKVRAYLKHNMPKDAMRRFGLSRFQMNRILSESEY